MANSVMVKKESPSLGKFVCTENCVLCLRNISAHASNAPNRFDNSVKDKTKFVFHSLFTVVVAVTVKYVTVIYIAVISFEKT